MPGGVVKKKKKRSPRTYAVYIHKVLQQVAPKAATGLTISNKSVQLLNGILCDVEKRLTDKSFAIAVADKKRTLNEKHMKTAVNMILPPELAGHASREIVRALTQYSA